MIKRLIDRWLCPHYWDEVEPRTFWEFAILKEFPWRKVYQCAQCKKRIIKEFSPLTYIIGSKDK